MAYVAGPSQHGYSLDTSSDLYTLDSTSRHPQQHHFSDPNAVAMPDSTSSASYFHPAHLAPPPAQITCDSKPRLTKEQHDVLEAHYKEHSKPNTNMKKTFADALNVSLDKVNNWFQNRRAKSKQDLKKQHEQAQLPQQHQSNTFSYPEVNSSPAFPNPDYFAMMQDCSSTDQLSTAMSTSHQHQLADSSAAHANHMLFAEPSHGLMPPNPVVHDMYDSPMDMHRRTLTQEQFDAFAQTGPMISDEHSVSQNHDLSAQEDLYRQMFAHPAQSGFKFPLNFDYPHPPVAPSMSSNDSSIPSNFSEQYTFPIAPEMHDAMAMSASSSEMNDNQGVSASMSQEQEEMYMQMAAAQQAMSTASQWPSGQSLTVDSNTVQQQFHQSDPDHLLQQQQLQQEQSMSWPDKEFARRGSHSSASLAQQMSNFVIETPHPTDASALKSPAPSANIAARRQRPRPAALGLASLRSKSYSGSVQPGSPSHLQQQMHPGQALRRIRSSNVINGVAAGRVGKPIPGVAQRSPLGLTFAESISSPKAIRHASTSSAGTLAPPTPLPVGELTGTELQPQAPNRPPIPQWTSSSGHVSCQASISETDAEHKAIFDSTIAMPPPPPAHQQQQQQQHVTSPPQTPSFQQTSHPQFAPPPHMTHAALQNTPPQSAPACQQTFSASALMPPPPQALMQLSQPTMPIPLPYQLLSSHPQHIPGVVPSAEQYHAANMVLAASAGAGAPQFVVPSMPPSAAAAAVPSVQYQFASGVPMINDHGQLTMAFPQPINPMSQVQFLPPALQNALPHGAALPGVAQYTFAPPADGLLSSSAGKFSLLQQHHQHQQQPSELTVHEYSPPSEMKRAALPRKPIDSGPKNYTFANQGPEHFEKDKSKRTPDSKGSSVTSDSPVSMI